MKITIPVMNKNKEGEWVPVLVTDILNSQAIKKSFGAWRMENMDIFPWGKKQEAKKVYRIMLGNLEKELPTLCSYAIPELECAAPQQEQEKGNNPMNYDFRNNSTIATATILADTSEKDKRQHLRSRLNQLFWEKREKIDELFGFGPIDQPKSAKEALERIQAGKFTIEGADKDEKPRYRFDLFDAFSWRDPSVKQDSEGRQKAYDELQDFKDGLEDIIEVKPLDEAFDTLQKLKDWQPTGKAN